MSKTRFALIATIALTLQYLATSVGRTEIQTGNGVQLLGVPTAGGSPRPGAGGNRGGSVTSPVNFNGPGTDSCLTAAQFTELKTTLHAGGQKRAVIIRGGRFGISPYVQSILGRVASALSDVPKIKDMVDKDLKRPYLSDHEETKKALEDAGYAVDLMASSEYEKAGKLPDFKKDLEKMIRKPETTVVVYFGHGSPGGMWIVDKIENAVPSPAEYAARMKDGKYQAECISAADLKEWKKGNGLDALIMHGCQNGTETYLKEYGGWAPTDPTYADCLKPDGFLAGWVTYSVYLNPKTVPILDRYLCYMYNKSQLQGADRARASRYFMKSAASGRKVAMLASLNDEAALKGYNCRATLQTLDADRDVVACTLPEITNDAGLTAFIEVLYGIKCGPGALADDFKTFLIAYFKYLKANNITTDQVRRGPAPAFPDNPTTDDINKQLDYHGQPVLAGALEAIVPKMILLRNGKVRLSDGDKNHIFVELHMDIQKSEQVEDIMKIMSSMNEANVEQGIANGIGFDIGPQVATRVKSTADRLIKSIPRTMIEVKVDAAVEKVVQPGANKLKPTIYGYNLAAGAVPAAKKASTKAPYEIHIGLPTASTLSNTLMSGLFGNEVKIYDSWVVDFFARLWQSYGVRRVSDDTVRLPMRWEIRAKYPGRNNNGYGYIGVELDLKVTADGDLKLKFDPTVRVNFEEGWPFPDWANGIISGWVSDEITKKAKERLTGIDFADYIPADVKPEIAGKVKIDEIKIDGDCISVYIKR